MPGFMETQALIAPIHVVDRKDPVRYMELNQISQLPPLAMYIP
jgi:hypothetical protein